MTKTILYSLFALGALILSIIIISNNIQKDNQESAINESGEETTVTTGGKKMAFAEFLRQDKGSYECTVNQYIDEGMTQSAVGRVFLDGGRIRGDFSVDVSGMSLSASTLVVDGFTYSWTSVSPMGFKAPVAEGEETGNAGMQGSYYWNANQIGDYDCQTWQVDETKFVLPEDVTFQEV